MRVDTFRGPHVQRTECAQTATCQMAVDCRGCQDHWHRHLVRTRHMIGQNDVTCARAHRIFGFGADAGQFGLQRVSVARHREGTVDFNHICVELFDHLVPLGICHKGAVQNKNFGLRTVFVQHVFEVTKTRFQRHHAIFTQTVDGWVGDLAKVLAEIMAKWAIFLGQNRRWGIVAHRGQSFFAILCHWGQNLFQLFDAIACRDLALTQFCACKHWFFFDL